jgi:hypothetical protein
VRYSVESPPNTSRPWVSRKIPRLCCPQTYGPSGYRDMMASMAKLPEDSETTGLIEQADKAPSGTEKDGPSWMNLTEKPTILILRSEAEAVIRFDPIFPADPFACKGAVDSD